MATTTTTTGTRTMSIPTIMRAWQWSTCKTTLEAALTLNSSAPLPTRPLSPGECLIHVHAASLNPVDYKLAELPVIGCMAIPMPATPGLDFAGVIVKTSPESSLEVGQRVFGKLEPKQQYGTLGEYIIGSKAGTVPLPEQISFEEGATMGVCGLVTYQCLVKNVENGDRVLINGGSGGTGTFALQIAKALGCEVFVTCSAANVQLCKDLGADEAIDYRAQNVTSALEKSGKQFDFVLDNVGEPAALYWKATHFTKKDAKYVQIGSQVSLGFIFDLAFRFVMPAWLGGGQRPFSFAFASANFDDSQGLADLVAKGKVKPVIDEVFDLEHVPEAYKKLRTGRAKGKIVVRVASKS
ncbi:oxidoreductase domain-containing protein [Didymella exigua CBS 183.55]|uniref:Oxidoreductase domain-containing protein n=1 Tax=Didymella exigua CBS 183.55 TaxID=1150837 RepID=A0A6A5REX3_9PLEO|nr:oxidoreductase domain-containing protein [Didymella exigua CBS 183.55]KAF1926841.1 oxidoreductase domain-containing protein [Didymella exigua CBS 183.55]